LKYLLLIVLVMAAARGTAAAEGAPYGAAGCGLGSVVFGDKPGMIQLFAATTNFLLFNQTFGITSGTLNCGAAADNTVAAHEFIETNREAFAKDISRGSGETIEVISALGGCADVHAVGRKLQQSFKLIFPDSRVANTRVSAVAMQTLKLDKALACSLVI
jgi:hypothetical protein